MCLMMIWRQASKTVCHKTYLFGLILRYIWPNLMEVSKKLVRKLLRCKYMYSGTNGPIWDIHVFEVYEKNQQVGEWLPLPQTIRDKCAPGLQRDIWIILIFFLRRDPYPHTSPATSILAKLPIWVMHLKLLRETNKLRNDYYFNTTQYDTQIELTNY